MSQTPIHIVGAGLCGLTLGHCLRQKGITSILYERAAEPNQHKYAITLHPWAFRPLLQFLNMDETTFRKKMAIDAMGGGSGKPYAASKPGVIPVEDGSLRAHRATLEAMLREGLDVKLSHTLEKAVIGDKNVTLNFEKGERVTCEAVIAADGIHSMMRKSLLPSNSPKVLPYVVLNGKRRIKEELFDDLYSPYLKDGTMIETRSGESLLSISTTEYKGDIIGLSYTFSRPAQDDDKLHRPDRPTSGAKEITEAFYEEIEQLKGLPQPFADMFESEKIRQDRNLHWLMRTSFVDAAELQKLAASGVLMVGDSAHGQQILGGNGANQAMKDGVELAKHIVKHGMQNLRIFVDKHSKDWSAAVATSEERIKAMHAGGEDTDVLEVSQKLSEATV